MIWGLDATGRVLEICIFTMVFGTTNEFFQRAMSNSQARLRLPGKLTGGRSMAPSSGSMVTARFRYRRTPTIWQAQVGRPRSLFVARSNRRAHGALQGCRAWSSELQESACTPDAGNTKERLTCAKTTAIRIVL